MNSQSAQAAPAQAAQAQYEQLKPDAKFPNWIKIKTPSDERRAIEGMLTGTNSFDQKAFDSFFNYIVFPQFTLQENIFATSSSKAQAPKSVTCNLPAMRKDFKQIFLKDATNQQARNRLNQLTSYFMYNIATRNFHPIARYNAALLLADLNEDEATETPYRAALGNLVNLARSDSITVGNAKYTWPEGVRVAALCVTPRPALRTICGSRWQACLRRLSPTTSAPPAALRKDTTGFAAARWKR